MLPGALGPAAVREDDVERKPARESGQGSSWTSRPAMESRSPAAPSTLLVVTAE